ncbi:hypothetical protein [Mycobacteroides salmoniphilum]|uniref:hypothetical protein n=1 Tax=Mycobacteroides salmoniphilum TaxID=404941 RepID=UPI0039E1F951
MTNKVPVVVVMRQVRLLGAVPASDALKKFAHGDIASYVSIPVAIGTARTF